MSTTASAPDSSLPWPRSATVLEIGCGASKRAGAVGLDAIALPGVDIVHNLDSTPWPLPDGHFEHVYAQDVLEHVEDFVAVVAECHRVLRPGGKLSVRMPFAGSAHHYTDPTHRRGATSRTFDYFTEDGIFRKYSYTPVLFRLDSFRYLRQSPMPAWIGWAPNLVDRLVFPVLARMHDTYEHYLAGLYPALDIEFELTRV